MRVGTFLDSLCKRRLCSEMYSDYFEVETSSWKTTPTLRPASAPNQPAPSTYQSQTQSDCAHAKRACPSQQTASPMTTSARQSRARSRTGPDYPGNRYRCVHHSTSSAISHTPYEGRIDFSSALMMADPAIHRICQALCSVL